MLLTANKMNVITKSLLVNQLNKLEENPFKFRVWRYNLVCLGNVKGGKYKYLPLITVVIIWYFELLIDVTQYL